MYICILITHASSPSPRCSFPARAFGAAHHARFLCAPQRSPRCSSSAHARLHTFPFAKTLPRFAPSPIVRSARSVAPSHFQSLYEVWHGVGCQIRRQAGHGAARTHLRGVWLHIS